MKNKKGHAEKVESFFNSLSMEWERNYEADGIMAERAGRFTGALTERLPSGSLVLDFGCGSGDLTNCLLEAGFQMHGYDLSEMMIKRARERYESSGIIFTCSGADFTQKLPYDDGTFDAVTASSVFEYIEDPVSYFKEIFRLLKPGGFFILTVPDNRHTERIKEKKKVKFYNKKIISYFIKFLPDIITKRLNTDFYRISKTRPEIETWVEMLRLCGFTVESVPQCYAPLVLLVATC
ncbi:MAG: class I SAM-dependent methyltransferase [Nitrospirae bacterium YQR-1]